MSVVEITVTVKQFPLGLCGLLKKMKLSLVSLNFLVLQVTSGSLGEAERIFLCRTCMVPLIFYSRIV